MNIPEFTHMLYEEDGYIATATVNRPKAFNALNEGLWHDFMLLAEYLETADHIRAVIITGAGDKAFMAGGDIKSIAGGMTALSSLNNELVRALGRLDDLKKPIIGAVNGLALGGGLEVALVCDIRIASENAKFGLPETDLGLIPCGGGTQRLPRAIGMSMAKQIIMGGRVLNAKEAEACGLVMKVVPQEELMAEARKLANKMAAKGPVALSLVKTCINQSMDTDRKTGQYMELLTYGMLMSTEDKEEGLSAFLEKRKPEFKGR